MSKDFQFISVVDDLQVLAVEEVEDADPRTVRVFGKSGFLTATRIVINGVNVDDFTVVSDRSLLVELSSTFDSLEASEMEVIVISSDLTGTKKVRLVFDSTVRTRTVSGLQKLVQQVVKTLLTDAGTNRFDISEGGDLLRGLGAEISPKARSRVASVVARAVTITEEHYIARQTGKTLPSTERLMSLSLVDVSFDESRLAVVASIQLVTFAGTSISIPLTL